MKKILKIAVIALMPFLAAAQPAYQSAYRALEEYKTTMQEGKPDLDYLMKAKEKIDADHNALKGTADSVKPKNMALYCKVYYYLFLNNWNQEKKKLSATITNAAELAEAAYGSVSTKEFEIAGEAMGKVFLQEQNEKEKPYTMELGLIALGFINDMQNLAIGKFKAKKYDEAMDYFESTYMANKQMGKKDTSTAYNALLSAEYAKKTDKVLSYGKMMIDDKVAGANIYNKIHFAHLTNKDTAKAEETLKTGLGLFPNDKFLILNYISICLQTGKQSVAMEYIDKAIAKDPKNCALYIVKGNTFDNQANPKSAKTGKDTTKPANFEELMIKAEACYLKAVECDPAGFDACFNLGAVYNNWGNWYSQKDSKTTAADDEKKSKEYWEKAIIYLEKADSARGCDKGVMFNLKRLYYMTEKKEKGDLMKKKMAEGCK